MSPAPSRSCKIRSAAPLARAGQARRAMPIHDHLHGNPTVRQKSKHGGRSTETFSEDISRVWHLCWGARDIWALWNYAQRVTSSSARKPPRIFREIAHQTNHWWYVTNKTHTDGHGCSCWPLFGAVCRQICSFFLWSPLKTASIDFSHPSCMYSIESACLEPLVDLCNTRLHTSNTVPG